MCIFSNIASIWFFTKLFQLLSAYVLLKIKNCIPNMLLKRKIISRVEKIISEFTMINPYILWSFFLWLNQSFLVPLIKELQKNLGKPSSRVSQEDQDPESWIFSQDYIIQWKNFHLLMNIFKALVPLRWNTSKWTQDSRNFLTPMIFLEF